MTKLDIAKNLPRQLRIKEMILHALNEDLGDGDVTTETIIPEGTQFAGNFIAKADGIIAGLDVARWTFELVNAAVRFESRLQDGDKVKRGQIIATVQGPASALLQAERVALNFLQRMSGIATATHQLVAATGGKCVVLDTRKTVPGLRILDKMAVLAGGGQNHRFGLFDMVLIKENHITVAGSITEAVTRARRNDKRNRPIEVEVKNLDELKEALALPVDRIMLDNFPLEMIREAVEITNGRVPLEVSGNVNLETIGAIAETGVDFVSVGRVTHSVEALDISLILEEIK